MSTLSLTDTVAKWTLESRTFSDSKRTMPQVTDLKLLTSIVAIDRNGAIGAHNNLPWRLKNDLKFFKKTTSENTVVMGRKTFDSIGHCLPNRKNVVLSHKLDLFESSADCRLVHSIPEALYHSETTNSGEIFIVGGGETYRQFAPFVQRYLVTVVDHSVADADAFLAKSILKDFTRWDHKELMAYPAVAGQDDFAFTIFEILPDNVEQRSKLREELIHDYSAQIKRSPRPSQRRKSNEASQQLSFI